MGTDESAPTYKSSRLSSARMTFTFAAYPPTANRDRSPPPSRRLGVPLSLSRGISRPRVRLCDVNVG